MTPDQAHPKDDRGSSKAGGQQHADEARRIIEALRVYVMVQGGADRHDHLIALTALNRRLADQQAELSEHRKDSDALHNKFVEQQERITELEQRADRGDELLAQAGRAAERKQERITLLEDTLQWIRGFCLAGRTGPDRDIVERVNRILPLGAPREEAERGIEGDPED